MHSSCHLKRPQACLTQNRRQPPKPSLIKQIFSLPYFCLCTGYSVERLSILRRLLKVNKVIAEFTFNNFHLKKLLKRNTIPQMHTLFPRNCSSSIFSFFSSSKVTNKESNPFPKRMSNGVTPWKSHNFVTSPSFTTGRIQAILSHLRQCTLICKQLIR